jgi:hypothetical protein
VVNTSQQNISLSSTKVGNFPAQSEPHWITFQNH